MLLQNPGGVIRTLSDQTVRPDFPVVRQFIQVRSKHIHRNVYRVVQMAFAVFARRANIQYIRPRIRQILPVAGRNMAA